MSFVICYIGAEGQNCALEHEKIEFDDYLYEYVNTSSEKLKFPGFLRVILYMTKFRVLSEIDTNVSKNDNDSIHWNLTFPLYMDLASGIGGSFDSVSLVIKFTSQDTLKIMGNYDKIINEQIIPHPGSYTMIYPKFDVDKAIIEKLSQDPVLGFKTTLYFRTKKGVVLDIREFSGMKTKSQEFLQGQAKCLLEDQTF